MSTENGAILRSLTDDEMRFGLDKDATTELAMQAETIRRLRELTALRDNCLQFKSTSEQIAASLLANGHPAFLRIEGVDGIVRQMPDGTRHAIEIVDGSPVVVRELPTAPRILP